MYTDHRSLALTLTLFTLAHSTKHAIFFGIGEYHFRSEGSGLVGPPNDVALMQNTLKQKGFTVRAFINPTADEMVSHFDKWLESIENGDEIVFFFSGHGGQSGSTRYLTGSDQKLVKGKYQGMQPLIDFQFKLQTKNSDGVKVFITDCCAGPMINKDGTVKVYEGNVGFFPNKILNEVRRSMLRNTYLFGAKSGCPAALQQRENKIHVGYITGACAKVIQAAGHVNLQTFEKNVREVLTQTPNWRIDVDGPIREMKEQLKAMGCELDKETEDILRADNKKDIASRLSESSFYARPKLFLSWSNSFFFRVPAPADQPKAAAAKLLKHKRLP